MGKNATYTSYNFTGSKAKQCYTGAFIQCFKTNVTSLQQKSKELIPHNKRVVLSNIFNTCLQQTSSASTSTSTSCCGSDYPDGPYFFPYVGCSGFNVYYNSTNDPCCCNSPGNTSMQCPPCVYT
jgi:hypothetical protein